MYKRQEKNSAMLIDNYDSYFESLLFKNIVDKNEIMNFLEHMLCLSIKENWLLEIVVISGTMNPAAVSYTHLDVYKRQSFIFRLSCPRLSYSLKPLTSITIPLLH